MNDYIIIRDKDGYKQCEEEADEIFRRVYHKLRWTTPYRVLRAKELSIMMAYELQQNLTSTGCVVISKSERKEYQEHEHQTP